MPWNKGFTKLSHLSVRKISETMKQKRLDNFKKWRDRMKKEGKIKTSYPSFLKSKELAELIGVVLGDGHIEKFPRTERIYISSHSENSGFIRRYENILQKIFNKNPNILKTKKKCIRIGLYEKYISKRLGVPTGSRKEIKFILPYWIRNNKKILIPFLRGLYEAEGSYCIHKQTATYKFIFSNKNESLLLIVFLSLKRLGFHPHRDAVRVQISRRKEVEDLVKLIQFRYY